MAITTTQLSAALAAAGLPAPSAHFLSSLLANNRTTPPLPALLATAKHRLLTCDLASQPSLLAASTPSLPPNVSAPQVRELLLPATVPVQVLAVEDLGRSRWEQVEAIAARERGEATKGWEIIRVVESENEEAGAPQDGVPARAEAGSAGPHRLVLQDVKGQKVYGLELKAVKGIGMSMSIGTKLFLKGATVARGVVLLEPETVQVLGGKVEALHKVWLENRKDDLIATLEGRA